MSNQVSVVEELQKLEPHFNKQNAYALKFESECLFAKQQLLKNDYVLKAAQGNPNSLRAAILNVAAIGISLNPALAHAYLVPRSPGSKKDTSGKWLKLPAQICLDISYRGLVKLATDSGAIKWAKPELVYDDEDCDWVNMVTLPIHKIKLSGGKRATGKAAGLIGGYCIAQLSDDSYLVDFMPIADIEQVRSTSKAENGPWKEWPLEMIKKTLVKRASKSWPQSGGRERLDKAIEIVNEHEGLADTRIVARQSDYLRPTPEQTETYLELAKGDSADFYIWVYSQDERLRPSLPGCEFEPRKKGEMMKYYNSHLENGRIKLETWTIDLQALCESGDDHGTAEFLADFEGESLEWLLNSLSLQHQAFARPLVEDNAA